MSNLWKASLQQATQSGMMTVLGLLKSGKLILRHTSDRCDLMKLLSWRMTRKVRPGFSHEETLHDGTDRPGRPDIDSQEGASPQQFVIGNDEAELELSVESRSFVNRVKDQVRKRQKRREGEEHSIIWGMFMTVTMESAAFMGKNYQNNCHSIVNTADLTLKQMFDISTKLVSEQDEISGLETIGWEKHSWKYLSLIGDERIINLQRTKVYVFSDSVLCLGKIHQNPKSNEAWKNRIEWITSSQSYRDFDGISGEPTEFEWNIFPGFDTLQLYGKVKDLLKQIRRNTRNFLRKILFMSMFNDISFGTKDNEEECLANARLVSLYARRFGEGQWSFVGPGSEKKWSLSKKTVHKESGTKMQKRCCWNSLRADVQFSVLRLHCPEVNSKAKDMENCRYTMQPTRKRLRLFFE